MKPPKLIQLPIHWELATWDDFTHIDHNGNDQMNMYMPYIYMDASGSARMARLQTQTDINYLKLLISKERVYRISKASTDEFIPSVHYRRIEGV